MRKTFKSAVSDKELTVRPSKSGDGVLIAMRFPSSPHRVPVVNMVVSIEDIPAIMVALAEAAGWPEEDAYSVTHVILHDLARVIRSQAERAEQAELEAEAFELATLYQGYGEWAKELSFSDLDEDSQKKWLDVARRARELGASRE